MVQIGKYTAGKITGISLWLMAVMAGVAFGYGIETLTQAGNSSVDIIKIDSALYWITCFSWTLVFLLDIIVSIALYFYFTEYKTLSFWNTSLRLLYSFILFIALLNLYQLYPATTVGMDTLAFKNTLNTFLEIWTIGLIVFGLHLIVLSFLLKKEQTFSLVFFYLTLFVGACYFGTALLQSTWGEYHLYKKSVDMWLGTPMAIGELAIATRLLLIKKT